MTLSLYYSQVQQILDSVVEENNITELKDTDLRKQLNKKLRKVALVNSKPDVINIEDFRDKPKTFGYNYDNLNIDDIQGKLGFYNIQYNKGDEE